MRSEEEVNQAIERYADTVRRICMVHLKNESDTEDIFQTVFLKYALFPRAFQSGEHEKAWMIRVTINETKNALRFRAVRREEDIAPLEEILPDREQQEVFRDILLLPARYKIVLQLYYVEGYKTAEIAEILKISPAAVRKRLEKGRKQMKLIYTEEEYG